MFPTIKNQVNFPAIEEEVLQDWKKQDIFKKTIANRHNAKPYVFYDGPPFATGLPHHGHLLAGTIKDIIPRYYTMQGYKVERRFGWDCHGLPVEMEMQKQLKLEKNADIEKYGIGKFNEECRKIVLRYVQQWRGTVERLGRWVDFDNDYKTMNKDFMESVWWVFNSLYKKGLIYEGYKVVPYSWAAGTILSNFEANLGYKPTNDPSIVVKFTVSKPQEITGSNTLTYFLAWTTTPWTLVGNLALCVNANNKYIVVEDTKNNCHYILGEKAYSRYFTEGQKIIKTILGSKLEKLAYEPVLPYATNILTSRNEAGKINTVLADNYVSDENGTGIVQMAPVYGEDDFRVGSDNGLPHFDPVGEDGSFLSEIDFVAGLNIKKADTPIMRKLRSNRLLFKEETISHSYPFCWRTDMPLMYKAISTWFVNVEKIKKTLLRENNTIHWVPSHIKSGRFGKWLDGARDWAISRNRYWGTPIPVWKADDGEIITIGSVAELEELSGKKITDLHKHFVDEITLTVNGKAYHRIREVLDCWFESGSMPYAASHYPFENSEEFEKNFPANFIAEGLDQTRGWFYTLLVIGVGLFEKTPFKNVIVNGLILAEDGKKMSKRLKNYPEPNMVLNQYGSDALRMYMISSPVIRGETLRFSENGIKNIIKTITLPLWNVFSFFTTYANIDGWDDRENPVHLDAIQNKLDRWIFSNFQTLIKNVNLAMEEYLLYKAVTAIGQFIDDLTNIYIRRSRRRFWKSENDDEKTTAYLVLYNVLKDFCKVLAPFAPFISHKIFDALRTENDPESVHLCDFPKINETKIDINLENEMHTVNELISLGRAARLAAGKRIRQPLSKLVVVSQNTTIGEIALGNSNIIKTELNVKDIIVETNEEKFVNYTAKANFKTLGKKIGGAVKEVNTLIQKLSSQEVLQIVNSGGTVTLQKGKRVLLNKEDIDLRREEKGDIQLQRGSNFSIFLNVTINEELEMEGLARELVHAVQRKRKEKNLEYSSRIKLWVYSGKPLLKAANTFKKYIGDETLAVEIFILNDKPKDSTNNTDWKEIIIENEKTWFKIEVV